MMLFAITIKDKTMVFHTPSEAVRKKSKKWSLPDKSKYIPSFVDKVLPLKMVESWSEIQLDLGEACVNDFKFHFAFQFTFPLWFHVPLSMITQML